MEQMETKERKIHYLKKFKQDIICLQETYIRKKGFKYLAYIQIFGL